MAALPFAPSEGSMKTSGIDIAAEFFLEAPSEGVRQTSDYMDFAWEASAFVMRSRLICEMFPDADVRFLALPTGFAGASVARALVSRLADFREALSIWIDVPMVNQDLLVRAVQAFPAPTAVTLSAVVAHGTVAASGHAHGAEVVFFESADPTRWLVNALLNQEDCPVPHSALRPLGGQVRSLRWRYRQGVPPVWPVDALPTHGWVPWLQAVFANSEPTPGPFAVSSFFEVLSSGTGRHLLIGEPGSLLGFVRACGEAKDGVVSVAQIRAERAERAAHTGWAVARVDGRSACEHAAVCGFLAKGLMAPNINLHGGIPDVFGEIWSGAFRRVQDQYSDWTRHHLGRGQETQYFRFAHRLAQERGALFPCAFDMVLAAQATIDANFSYEFLKECQSFPGSEGMASSLPELSLPLDAFAQGLLHLSVARFETLQAKRFQRKKLSTAKNEKNKIQLPREPVEETKYADNRWLDEEHVYSCSFPEEDIFMEDFAFQCRDQVRERVRARDLVIHEMGASLGDGLDVRATARNWHLDKIMIREEMNVGRADVGAVIFQFANPDDDDRFSWFSFWLAEAHDKSDLMFYATPYRECVVGPGIAKSEFGGFAVIPLPNYLGNPWADPFLRHVARRPADALLVAAAVATDHRSLLYIGAYPPGHDTIQLLKRSGKSVITLGLDELPPDKVRRLRTFHILAEAGVRSYAQKYIRKD